jgi:hypothetical protein
MKDIRDYILELESRVKKYCFINKLIFLIFHYSEKNKLIRIIVFGSRFLRILPPKIINFNIHLFLRLSIKLIYK